MSHPMITPHADRERLDNLRAAQIAAQHPSASSIELDALIRRDSEARIHEDAEVALRQAREDTAAAQAEVARQRAKGDDRLLALYGELTATQITGRPLRELRLPPPAWNQRRDGSTREWPHWMLGTLIDAADQYPATRDVATIRRLLDAQAARLATPMRPW